jgi:hypothetical protein
MTQQERTYDRIINRVTDQLMKLTIGHSKEYEKVLFFADQYFLFFIPEANLAHCLLPTITQAKRQDKIQTAKSPMLLVNRLIRKVVFHSIKGNN